MIRSFAAAALIGVMLVGLAAAGSADAAPKAKAKAEKGEAEQLSSRSMDAPYLAVPVVRNGYLANYLFVSVRVEIASGVDLWRTREQAHILRDALVRASHEHDLSNPEDPHSLNEARAIEVYRAAAIAALGERAVAAVTIVATYSSQGGGV